MRVAIVTEFPRNPARPHGGVEAVSVNLVRSLTAFADLDIHVVTTDAACRAPQRDELEGVSVHRLPRTGARMLTHAVGSGRRAVRSFLAQLKPDVVHAHDYYGLMVKGMSTPRVFTIHGFIHADTLCAGGRVARLRSCLWRWVETNGWAEQPHIISISPYVREHLAGIARGVIHDIDNPIAEAFFKIKRHERNGTVFCAALICPRKNQVALIEAIALLRNKGIDVELRLAGAFVNSGYAERVRKRIVALRLQDHVKLLGPLGRDQVMEELAAASVFSLTSLEEGSPMGIEEAMASKLPVVTSNRCGMPYMVRHGESGYLVNPEDADDIGARLERLLNNASLRERMGRVGRMIAEDRFHPDRVAQRTCDVYREIALSATRSTS